MDRKLVVQYRVKFRAFGVTVGTVKGSADATATVRLVATALASGALAKAGPFVNALAAQRIEQEEMPELAPFVILDDRGVYLALASE